MAGNTINPDQLINQMRLLAAQARAPAEGAAGQPGAAAPAEFQNALVQALDSVNGVQQNASNLAKAFEKGEPGVELVDVMVSLQKASVAFEAATQVRNRLVSAYQEIMNMPV